MLDGTKRSGEMGAELESWIRGDSFSCLAAKASLRRGNLLHIKLGDMGSETATEQLHRELIRFVNDVLSPTENFHTLIAVFSGPAGLNESEFEDRFWKQLTALHEVDRRIYSWTSEADSDPDSMYFGFSIAEHPFFLVGMHDGASRISRKFPLPAIAFNSQHQFTRLRRDTTYGGLARRIRRRELRLQGSVNPNWGNFGEVSDARQYSGRAVEQDWVCPFQALPRESDEA